MDYVKDTKLKEITLYHLDIWKDKRDAVHVRFL